MSGQSITEILNLINQQDWESLNKQVTGPYMKQLVSIITESFPNGVLADGKTIQEAITLLQQGGTGGGGNTFDPDYFKVAEGLVTFIAKYISLAPRTAVNVAGLTVSAVAPQQVALADGVYTLSLTQDFQNEELDIRFANGVIMPTGNRAKVSFDVKCENISQLSDFKFGLYLIEGANTWTYYDEDTVPSADYQSVSFIVDGDKVNDYTQFRLVLISKTGAKVFLSNAKVYFDNVRFEYWPLGDAAGGLQLPVANLLLTTPGLAPELPPAGKVPGDDGYDIQLHILPGQIAINQPDQLLFYNTGDEIKSFRVILDTDDLPLADPTKQSLDGLATNVSQTLEQYQTAILSIRDAIRQVAGAAATIEADPKPQQMTNVETSFTFIEAIAATNPDIIEVDAVFNQVTIKQAGLYQFATFLNVSNAAPVASHNLTLRTKDTSDDEIITERTLIVPASGYSGSSTFTFQVQEADLPLTLDFYLQADHVSDLVLNELQSTLLTGAQVNTTGGLGIIGYETNAAIRAITGYAEGNDALCFLTGAWYKYDPTNDNTANPDDDDDVLVPNDNVSGTGAWIKYETFAKKSEIPTVDSALDENSTNPVENRVVTNRPLSTIKPDAGNANKIPVVSADGTVIGYTAFTVDQIVQLAAINTADPTWQENETRLLEVKKVSGQAAFEGATQLIDIFAPPGNDAALTNQIGWSDETKTLTGENFLGQLGKTGQLRVLADGTICRCISSVQGTDGGGNGSATYRRNRAVDTLDPDNNSQDSAVCDLLDPSRTGGNTDDGWDLVTNIKVISTIPARLGTWHKIAGSYGYFCYAVVGNSYYFYRTGTPAAIYRQISAANYPNLTANLLAHDFTNGVYTDQGGDEQSYHDQTFYDVATRSYYIKINSTQWEKIR